MTIRLSFFFLVLGGFWPVVLWSLNNDYPPSHCVTIVCLFSSPNYQTRLMGTPQSVLMYQSGRWRHQLLPCHLVCTGWQDLVRWNGPPPCTDHIIFVFDVPVVLWSLNNDYPPSHCVTIVCLFSSPNSGVC